MTDVLQIDNISRLQPASSAQWVEIQRNTFKNWVNEQLKSRGLSVVDLRTDFDDGVLLVALVEILQRKKVQGAVKKPVHNHEKLHNITMALSAISNDNVTLINIDSSHVTEGNVKMILGLVWQLITRYQIGLSNIQNRSWILAWIQAVLPECNITNLKTDLNSGVLLHALLDFCKPGISPKWRDLKLSDSVNNCREALKLARQHFGIPMILRPDDLASSELDEMSAITYLSYFTKVGAPGYNATLQKIQPLVRTAPVFNFTTDWNSGHVLCELVRAFGGNIPGWPDLRGSNSDRVQEDVRRTNIERLQEGLDGARGLGIEPLLTADQIVDQTSEHLGIMAYAARFLTLTPGVVSYEHNYKETKVITVEEINRTYNSTDTGSPRISQVRDTEQNGKDSSSSSSSSSSSTTETLTRQTQQELEYTFVRTPSLRRKQRQNIHTSGAIKKDTYSDGVIIYSTSHTLVSADDIRLEAESPTGRLIKMNGDGMYHAQFSQEEIGAWTVTLYINEKLVDTCRVDVCDPSQVRVSGIKAGLAGKRHNFTIDCSRAGRGKLEVEVKTENRNVPCYIKEETDQVYSVGFTPLNTGHYLISVIYNKAEIRDDAGSGPSEEELQRQAVFSTSMKPHHDHYKIQAACDWQIDYMTGGPIDLYIGDTADVKVYSMQDGTVCNVPHLIADCTNAPPGGDVNAEVMYGVIKLPAEVIEDQPGIYKIIFKPEGPGTYRVWITYGGHLVKGKERRLEVPGSPFIQEIAELTSPSAEGPGLKQGIPDKQATFKIDSRGFPGEITIDVQGPHYPIGSTFEKEPDNTYTVTYVPEEVGIHRIHIKLDNKDIQGSPYHPKIVDPDKVRVSGGWRPLMDDQERIPLVVGKEKHIPFDASEAGPGVLSGKVHGPSEKVPVTVDSRGDGKHTLIFVPREEGKHYIEVLWNDFPLNKSPYQGHAVPATEQDLVPVRYVVEPTVVTKESVPVHVKPVKKEYSPPRDYEPPSQYWVRADRKPLPTDNGPRKVYMMSPTRSEPVIPAAEIRPNLIYPPTRVRVIRHGSDIVPQKRKHYATPKRTGSVHSGTTVSTVKSEPRRKEPDVILTKLQRPDPIYTYQTSPPITDSIIYTASPQSSSPPSVSPSYIYAQPQHKMERPKSPSPKVVLRGRGLKEAELDKPAVFHVDGRNAGPGEPEAKIASVRAEPPIDIQPEGPKQYKCTYVPKVPGAYLLDITWNKKPLKCCPFKVNVKNPVYPEKVGVSGDNLKKGAVLGKDMDLKIDPRGAGKGELRVDCKDPDGHDVPVNLADNYDGTYRLRVRPEKPGKHYLNIRLNNQHVFGSPYEIQVRGPPKSKGDVKVYGPGLENGIFPDYQGHFFVDATGAGGGEIHVSVMGLKGAFHVEMQRVSQRDKLFNCIYNPVEPGLYTINVQWSGVHVRGSPYQVLVAGSEMELLEYESQVAQPSRQSSDRGSKFSPNASATANGLMY